MSRSRSLLSSVLLLPLLSILLHAYDDGLHDNLHFDDEPDHHSSRTSFHASSTDAIAKLRKDLTEQRSTVTVHVRLVGFGGDGNQELVVSEADLKSYLHTLPSYHNTTVLSLKENLLVGAEVSFVVSRASYRIAGDIQGAVDAAIKVATDGRTAGPTNFVEVDYKVVDAIIQKDLLHTKDDHFTIFIINLKPNSFKYAYKYTEKDGCNAAIWSSKRPYTWIDLTAGPVQYGPGPGQKGQVLAHSMPVISNYNTAVLKKAILPDLAALVASAVQHLVWPPLQHPKVEYRENIEVHVIQIHDALLPPGYSAHKNILEDELKHLQLENKQRVTVQMSFLGFSNCDVCVAGYAKALKVRSSRAKGAAVSLLEEPFLDSLELYDWILRNKDEIYGDAGIHEYHGHGAMVIPVFLFDISSPVPQLLDGQHQALAFPGMVLAVHSKAPDAVADFMCNGNPVPLGNADITRAVLGAVVQAGWGVADTSLSAGHVLQEQSNYLWSAGNDPHSPASNVAGLSYAQTSAAQRNMVLVKLNGTITRALDHLRALARLSEDRPITSSMGKQQIQKLDAEFGSLHARVQEAVNLVGSRSYAAAFQHIHQMEIELNVITQVMQEVHFDLEQHFVCKHNERFYSWMLGSVGVFALASVLFAVRRSQESKKTKERWY